nr:putative glycosyltransferase family 2 [uncultured bacterium]
MKISVVTVSYNSAKTIGDTLDSVAMQTHADIEHIVVDGASSDETLALVRRHHNSAIRLVSEPDKGIYDAMNKGFALASGEVIGFLNSDDFFADELALEKVAEAFRDESVEASYADLVYVSQDKSRVVRYWKSKPFVKGDFAKGWCPAHPTFYVRRSAIERLGLFDQSYKMGVDVEFMMRYLELGQVRALYIPHIMVRMRLGGASNQSWKNILLQNREILAALRKNGIPCSVVWFALNKVASRLNQFIAGRLGRHR